jgi:hypothetical protein
MMVLKRDRGFLRLGSAQISALTLQIAEPGEHTLYAKCMFPDMSFRHATVARLAGTPFPQRLFRCDAVLTPVSLRAGAACKRAKEAVMRVLMWPAAAALLIAVGLLSVLAANAQVQSPSPGLSDQSPDISDQKLDAGPSLSDQSPNISDQKLDAVATAIERVASLKQDYRQRIAAAAPSDKERIAFEAINALANAVTDQGLSLKEYDSILEVAQNDPEVREKIGQRIRRSAK